MAPIPYTTSTYTHLFLSYQTDPSLSPHPAPALKPPQNHWLSVPTRLGVVITVVAAGAIQDGFSAVTRLTVGVLGVFNLAP